MATPPVKDDGSLPAALLILAWWKGRKDVASEMLKDGHAPRADLLIKARDEARREVIRWTALAEGRKTKEGGDA